MKDIENLIKKYTSDTLLSKEVIECALWEAYWKGVADGRETFGLTEELSPYKPKIE